MRIYLGRHGEAGLAPSDKERALTPRGIAETEAVYRHAAELIKQPVSTVITSPLIRAQQTSNIACEQWSISVDTIITSDLLKPESPIAAVASYLDILSVDVALLIGHQPLLGRFLSWLCDEPDLLYRPATSSLFAVDVVLFSRGGGSLLWQQHSHG